jgi:uncharacterized RmlC-like cupin family protein
MTARITVVGPRDLPPGAATPGLSRRTAFDTEGATMMHATTDPGTASGWHHHGEHDVFGYVVRGTARFEFGPGGTGAAEVGTGELFHVPAGLIHRDVNPGETAQEIVLTLVGDGPLVVNVDGPEPSGHN